MKGNMSSNDRESWRLIQLTKGQVAIVDNDDYEYLSKRKWYAQWNPHTNSFYARTTAHKNGKQTHHYMHRVIMNTPRHLDCDHKNHNTWDNRRRNIQNVTKLKNCENLRLQSKYGVGIVKRAEWRLKKPYRVEIKINKKRFDLGHFTTVEEARNARENFIKSETDK